MARPKQQQYGPSVTGDPEVLIAQHGLLVKRIAHHLKARLPACVQVDDMYQAGIVGLLEAARNYNPVQGACFETYAGIRIRGAMLDELRRSDWTPKSVHRKSREIAEAIRRVEARMNRDARDSEIAEELGVSLEVYHQTLQDSRSSALFSLESLAGEENIVAGLEGEPGVDPLRNVQFQHLRACVAGAIAGLPERERMVVSLYYESELNLREIGNIIGVSESRISQLLSQALARLRSRMREWRDRD